MRLRLGKVTVADVLAAQPVTTNLLKFMRASIKMIGVSNLQSFIASMTQKLTLSRSEERFSRNAETDLVCRLLLEKKKGKKQVRFEDDGEGRAPDDARLALERHATSNIRHAGDLGAIVMYGYRGQRQLHSFPTRRSSDLVTTNLLKFMRASIKMIGVSNLQSFIASMTQKLTLS